MAQLHFHALGPAAPQNRRLLQPGDRTAAIEAIFPQPKIFIESNQTILSLKKLRHDIEASLHTLVTEQPYK
jgi:hypothetical protein